MFGDEKVIFKRGIRSSEKLTNINFLSNLFCYLIVLLPYRSANPKNLTEGPNIKFPFL